MSVVTCVYFARGMERESRKRRVCFQPKYPSGKREVAIDVLFVFVFILISKHMEGGALSFLGFSSLPNSE